MVTVRPVLRSKIGLPITRSGAHPHLSYLRLVNLIENAVVVEIGLLRFAPAAEEIVHREQFDLWELLLYFSATSGNRGR